MTYKKKLFLNFFAIFTVFTLAIIAIQYDREKEYKIESLRSNLSAYSTIIHNYITNSINSGDINSIESYSNIANLLPPDLRVTIINSEGYVLFDNNSQGVTVEENHLQRPEILSANINGVGYVMRKSETTGVKYYYQAKNYDDYFVRLALTYDMNVAALLKGDNLYIYFILAMFIIAFLSLLLITDRFGRSLSALRDFAYSKYKKNQLIDFPDGELGEIGAKLFDNFREIEESKDELKREKDKLILHFSHSTSGITFFSKERKPIYSNTLFISLLNTLTDTTTLSIEDFFIVKEFNNAVNFIEKNTKFPNIYEEKIEKNRQYYTLRVIIFVDRSIEVIIENVTSAEKNRILKQEMTSNIAHELRTPVSCISGYMETLIEQKEISPEKMRFFIERTYSQVKRLTDLIRDISIITRIEEGATEVEIGKIDINEIISEVETELSVKIEKSKSTIINNVPDKTLVTGNHILLYSIFRNLIDNAISYAGENTRLTIDRYYEDDNFHHFSVWDNGKGIDDKHLSKIFDRFYRTCEGRTRQDGGSGLGLSIVKNAILFHNGTVVAKNRKSAGLEIIFSIKK